MDKEIKELLTTATETALSVQQGDLEIAGNQLLRLVDPNNQNKIDETLQKVALHRSQVDSWLRVQKRSTLIGFLSLIALNAYLMIV